jgi:hypothetical protein
LAAINFPQVGLGEQPIASSHLVRGRAALSLGQPCLRLGDLVLLGMTEIDDYTLQRRLVAIDVP